MKKIISLMLTLILICALPASVFATDYAKRTTEVYGQEISSASINIIAKETGEEKESVVNNIESDIETLDKYSMPITYLVDVRHENGRMEYELDIPNISDPSIVSLTEDTMGNVTFYITEGDCNDILVMKADGSILLNGSQVTIEECASIEAENKIDSGSTRARYSQYSKNDFCPGATYVKTGDPKPYVFNTGNSYVKNISISALCLIIGQTIGGIPGGVVGALFSVIAEQIKSTAEAYCPTSTAASCKLQKYTKSPQSDPLALYYKYVGKYYANSDFTVYSGTSTYYEYNYFS